MCTKRWLSDCKGLIFAIFERSRRQDWVTLSCVNIEATSCLLIISDHSSHLKGNSLSFFESNYLTKNTSGLVDQSLLLSLVGTKHTRSLN